MLAMLLARTIGLPSVAAIRGATTVDSDEPAAIASRTEELLTKLRRENSLRSSEVISAIFTVTPDLVSSFPAEAARSAGWEGVPLLCTTEIPVPGGLPRCLRVMLHVQRVWRGQPKHVYLRSAASLRPDLVSSHEGTTGGVAIGI